MYPSIRSFIDSFFLPVPALQIDHVLQPPYTASILRLTIPKNKIFHENQSHEFVHCDVLRHRLRSTK